MSRGGKREGSGRRKTSAGWATVSLRLPLPTVESYRGLDARLRSLVRDEMRKAIERAIVSTEDVIEYERLKKVKGYEDGQ